MVPTQKGLTGDVEFIAEAYPVVEFGNYDIPEGWGNALAKPTQTGVPAQWENPNTTGFESDGEEETNLYFFHSDHLGSTNYLTDKDGVVQQSIVYQPYGEVLYEEKTYSNPYKFNGKELDTETGLAYYGARYYSPELSVWYGVDPLMEKYPNSSPYVFCAGNPVKYIDPNGKACYESRSVRHAKKYQEENGGKLNTWVSKDGKHQYASVTQSQVINNNGYYEFDVSAVRMKSKKYNFILNTFDSIEESLNIREGNNDCANSGKTTTKDWRAFADVLEYVSDGADGVACGMAVTGIGMAIAPECKLVGTLAGTASDVINITVDFYEENIDNAIYRIIGTLSGYFLPSKIKTNSKRVKIIRDASSDKTIDYLTNSLCE